MSETEMDRESKDHAMRGRIMKRTPYILIAIGVAALSMFAFAACDEEPTQAEANERFCDSVGDLVGALRNVRDIDRNSSQEEFQEARDDLAESYDAMISAAAEVREVRLDELNQARDDLQQAIDEVPDDLTVGETLDAVDDEVDNVVRELSQVFNDVSCGLEPGGDSQSDE
jgi:hypothetical protein